MATDTDCWMGVLYSAPHALGSEPERCLMCEAKQKEDAAQAAAAVTTGMQRSAETRAGGVV